MPGNKSLKSNFIMNAILTASSFIFPLITFPYVSRVLLPIGTGKVAFVTSVVSYFSMAAMLGIPTYGIRACAQVRDDEKALSKTVHEIFFINLIMTILVCAAYFICLLTIPQFRQEKLLYLVCGSTILFNLLGMEWLYKALEEYRYITVRSIIFKFLSVLLMFLLVRSKDDYVFYGAISVFAGVGSNIINFFNVRKHITVKYLGPYDYTRHLKPVFTFFSLTVAAAIYTNLDIVMLGFIKGDVEVGYYNSAVKVKFILVTLVTSLSTVLLPRISYYVKNNMKKEYLDLAAKAFQFVILISLPLCIYFTVMAKESILFLSGSAFLGSVKPMQIIMPTIIFIGLTNIIGIQLLVPLEKEKLVLYSTCAGAVVNVILNAFLIPEMGASGAAWGTVAAEAVVLIVQVVFTRGVLKEIIGNLHILRIAVSLLAAGLGLGVARQFSSGMVFVDLVVTAAAFFGIYGCFVLFLFRHDLSR